MKGNIFSNILGKMTGRKKIDLVEETKQREAKIKQAYLDKIANLKEAPKVSPQKTGLYLGENRNITLREKILAKYILNETDLVLPVEDITKQVLPLIKNKEFPPFFKAFHKSKQEIQELRLAAAKNNIKSYIRDTETSLQKLKNEKKDIIKKMETGEYTEVEFKTMTARHREIKRQEAELNVKLIKEEERNGEKLDQIQDIIEYHKQYSSYDTQFYNDLKKIKSSSEIDLDIMSAYFKHEPPGNHLLEAYYMYLKELK